MITGYASVFYDGSPSTEFSLGSNYVERIMPGAFDAALSSDADVVGLFNHDFNMVLGRTSADTMRLSIDKIGLRYEIDEGDTQIARDVAQMQQRGDVIGSSFGFIPTDERAIEDGDVHVREIHSVHLRDVGPVTFPAYEGTGQVRFVGKDLACLAVEDAARAAEARSCWHNLTIQSEVQKRARQVEVAEIRYRAHNVRLR